jgi:hypothetical protein
MTTHLYDLDEFPDTACGLSPGWLNNVHAVYGRDFDQVDCPDCLVKLQMPPREVHVETRRRESDPVYYLCAYGAVILLLLGLVWWWLW